MPFARLVFLFDSLPGAGWINCLFDLSVSMNAYTDAHFMFGCYQGKIKHN